MAPEFVMRKAISWPQCFDVPELRQDAVIKRFVVILHTMGWRCMGSMACISPLGLDHVVGRPCRLCHRAKALQTKRLEHSGAGSHPKWPTQ